MIDQNDVKNILSQILEISIENICETTSMKNLPNWDSLKHIAVVVALEDQYDIEFTMDEIVAMTNYSGIIRMLDRKAN